MSRSISSNPNKSGLDSSDTFDIAKPSIKSGLGRRAVSDPRRASDAPSTAPTWAAGRIALKTYGVWEGNFKARHSRRPKRRAWSAALVKWASEVDNVARHDPLVRGGRSGEPGPIACWPRARREARARAPCLSKFPMADAERRTPLHQGRCRADTLPLPIGEAVQRVPT